MTEYSTCQRKVRFRTWMDAALELLDIQAKPKYYCSLRSARPYKCPYADHWHFGHVKDLSTVYEDEDRNAEAI